MGTFVATYCWEIRPGKEEQFRSAWRRGTELIRRKYGSLGSRLHRAVRDDDKICFVGVAEWPDEASWREAFDAGMAYDEPATRKSFLDAICGAGGDPMLMEVTDDLLEADHGENT